MPSRRAGTQSFISGAAGGGSYSWRILLSVVWGKPKSITSSISSYTVTKLSRMLSSSSSLKYSLKTCPQQERECVCAGTQSNGQSLPPAGCMQEANIHFTLWISGPQPMGGGPVPGRGAFGAGPHRKNKYFPLLFSAPFVWFINDVLWWKVAGFSPLHPSHLSKHRHHK